MSASKLAFAAALTTLWAAPIFAQTTASTTPTTTTAAEPRIVALTESDARHYGAAFVAMDSGDWSGVRRELGQVQDDVLVATVEGRMLASPSNRASYGALVSWLRDHGDLAVASLVYERAQDIRPHRGRGRRRRAVGPAPPSPDAVPYRTPSGASMPPPGDSVSARSTINDMVSRIGNGDWEGARSLGEMAINGPRAGDANWWMGLIAYHDGRYSDAVRHFDAAAAWPYFSTWTDSAAHYWAARSRMAAGMAQGVTLNLEAAARNPYTFYGQLAEANLGRESFLSFQRPPLDETQLRHLIERRAGARRAAALAQLNRRSDVDAELRRLHSELLPSEDAIFLAFAGAVHAPSAQLRAAEIGGPELTAGFCPENNFYPDGGFIFDRALVFGIIRQESHFNPRAVSPSNARGLMQLLPSTARDVDSTHNYRRAPAPLFDPGLNMRLGQEYVRWLMEMFHQDQDLGQVFAAYNGGPGWLQRWMAMQPTAMDPLMLIETLPRAESRDYAERVLAHMGVCRARYGQQRLELESLAQGRPARYQAQDRAASSMAGAPASSTGTR